MRDSFSGLRLPLSTRGRFSCPSQGGCGDSCAIWLLLTRLLLDLMILSLIMQQRWNGLFLNFNQKCDLWAAVSPTHPCYEGLIKRLCLFLRWMIRGGQSVTLTTAERDLGTWQKLLPDTFDASKLIIPLDTHIARISRFIGLTDRTTTGLTTAQEITESLRRIHPADPLKYDMALCHLGISGSCPKERDLEKCAGCPIRQACRLGKTPRWDVGLKKCRSNPKHATAAP